MRKHPGMHHSDRTPKSRVLLVGCGYWGSRLLTILVGFLGEDGVAVADPSRKARSFVRSAHPGVAVHASPDACMDDPSVTAVFIATPPPSHASLAIRTLSSGRHVFIEKPMATCRRDAAAIVKASASRGLIAMVDHTYLFDGAVIAMRRLIAGGKLGRVIRIVMERENFGIYQEAVGVIQDLAPHDISIARYLLGAEPVSVQAAAYSSGTGAVASAARLAMRFPGGTDVLVSHDWFSPDKVRRVAVIGERASVLYESSRERSLTLYRNSILPENTGSSVTLASRGRQTVPFDDTEPLAATVRHFLGCVRTGRRPLTDAVHGAAVVAVIDACERSAAHGGRRLPISV